MIKHKSCPRCNGDILTDKDYLGWYEQGIQCGYQHYPDDSDTSGVINKEYIVKYARENRTRRKGN